MKVSQERSFSAHSTAPYHGNSLQEQNQTKQPFFDTPNIAESLNDYDSTLSNSAEYDELARDYDSFQNQQIGQDRGCYQVVIVFLLLLMSLLIMAIVYQLFFRPRPTTPKILGIETKALEESSAIPAKGDMEQEKRELKLESEGIAQSKEQTEQKQPVEQTTRKNLDTLSKSSPISSITPRGEEIRPVSNSKTFVSTKKKLPDNNEQLLLSKIGGIGYWIQVGAFSSLKNANKTKQLLTQNYLESVIQESKNETRKIYRVRVGLYTSKEEAERILRQVKNIDKIFAKSIIIHIEV